MRNNALLRVIETPKAIAVSLWQPYQSTLVQKWTFEYQPLIKIGRAADNHVVLLSSVVSRYHIEIRHINTHWLLINRGSNGTYLNDKSITTTPVVDGMSVRLALSGPRLQIDLGSTAQTLRQNKEVLV
jgi:serine/threonine-protein kinase